MPCCHTLSWAHAHGVHVHTRLWQQLQVPDCPFHTVPAPTQGPGGYERAAPELRVIEHAAARVQAQRVLPDGRRAARGLLVVVLEHLGVGGARWCVRMSKTVMSAFLQTLQQTTTSYKGTGLQPWWQPTEP